MHLAAKTDSSYFLAVDSLCEFFDAFHAFSKPVFRVLLRPARMGEEQRIFFGYDVADLSGFFHKKKFYSGSSKINANIIHNNFPPVNVCKRENRGSQFAASARLRARGFQIIFIYLLPNHPHGFSVGYLTPAGWL